MIGRAAPVVAAALALVLAPGRAYGQIGELKRLSLEQLVEQEITSVSKRPEPYGQAPAAIQVITQDDIRRSGATSLPEALRLVDNLMIAQKTSHGWGISARGFNADLANKLLVLIDGRTVYTPLFSGVFWDRQDYLLEDVERIEVTSGPGGALWGMNAVNGVINIITRRAQDSQGLYAEGGGGFRMQGLGGVRYGGSLSPTVSYRLYGKYADRGNERLADGREASDAWRIGQGGFRLDADPSSRDVLTLQGDVYAGAEHMSLGGTGRMGGGNLLGRWSRRLSNASEFNLQAYFDRTHLDIPVPATIVNGLTLAPAGRLSDDLDTYDVDFDHRIPLGARHRLTWGLGYRTTHDRVGNAPGLGFIPAVLRQHLFSGFVQDQIALHPRLSVTAGTKLEHNSYTGVEIEPSARLQWTAAPTRTIWAAVSRAIRAPARVDRDERVPTPALAPLVDNLLIGGRDFRSETVIAYEAGVRAQPHPTLALAASAFYNRYDDIRSTSLSPPDPVLRLPFPLFFDNNLEGDTHGVELSVAGQLRSWWRIRGGYTFFGQDIRVEPGRFDFNNALNETADPAHQFALRSAITVGDRLEGDAAFRWVDSLRFNNGGTPGRVPSYGELGGRLAWFASPHLELSIAAQNLLHARHLEYVISSPNPREEIGRRVHTKAAFRW